MNSDPIGDHTCRTFDWNVQDASGAFLLISQNCGCGFLGRACNIQHKVHVGKKLLASPQQAELFTVCHDRMHARAAPLTGDGPFVDYLREAQ